jgi:hypothetical protein
MTKRGVLYLHWGPDDVVLKRSVASVREHHPELPIHVETLPATASLLDKATMYDLSPFQETLFLDHDTVVLGRLEQGFALARKTGLACCICEMPWARRYGGLAQVGDAVEYNTGVLFFTKVGGACTSLFHNWKHYALALDSSIDFYGPDRQRLRMPHNDQAGFARAVLGWSGTPAVLPLNFNFRPSWHRSFWGPLKVWHDYRAVPAEVLAFSRQQQEPDALLEFYEFRPELLRA